MKVLNKLTGKLEEIPDDQVDAAVADSGGSLAFPTADETERHERIAEYGDQTGLAALESGVRTATFGAIPGFGTPEEIAARERTLREESPGVAFASQAAGTILPSLATGGAAGLAGKALGLGAGAAGALTGAVEGVTQGTAEELEQARYEMRDPSVGNILLYGVGGEIAGRAIPAVMRRGAAKLFGSDAASAIAGDAAENLAVKSEQAALKRAARDAPSMPAGAEREAVMARTANEQYDRAAREARQGLDDGMRRFSAIEDPAPSQIREMVAADAPVQMRWSTETVQALDGLAETTKSTALREALGNASQKLVDAEGAAPTFMAAREARRELVKLPASTERDAALTTLRQGVERQDLWGKAAEYEQDMGRAADKFQSASSDTFSKLAQGESFDPAKIRSVLQKDKVGRGLTEERLNTVLEAMQDRVQIHQKYGTAGESVLNALTKDIEKTRGAFSIGDEVQAAVSKVKGTPAAPKGQTTLASGLMKEGVETAADMALGALGVPPVAGIAMKLMRGIGINGEQAIKQTARRVIRPVISEAGSPIRAALTATALSRFKGEYPNASASFEAKKNMLSAVSQDPGLLAQAVSESFGTLPQENPELFTQLAARIGIQFQYITDNLPPTVATSVFYPRGVPASQSTLRDFALLWNSTFEPLSVIDDVEEGTAVPSQIRALKYVHPDTYRDLLASTVEEISTNFADVPTQRKVWLDTLFESDGLAGPSYSWKCADYIQEDYDRLAAMGPKSVGQGGPQMAEQPLQSAGLSAISAGVTNRGA